MAAQDFDVILFDLGGVLVELQGLDVLLGESLDESHTRDFWQRWLHSPAVRDFEAGRCEAPDFATALVAEFALPLTPARFLDNFLRWPRGFFAGAVVLLQSLRERHALAVLSNTNALHWQRFAAEPGFLACLQHSFLSFRSGHLKPDTSCYRHVADTLGVAPSRILFLDDNLLNVDGARAAGLTAERALGVAGVQAALRAHGIAA